MTNTKKWEMGSEPVACDTPNNASFVPDVI